MSEGVPSFSHSLPTPGLCNNLANTRRSTKSSSYIDIEALLLSCNSAVIVVFVFLLFPVKHF